MKKVTMTALWVLPVAAVGLIYSQTLLKGNTEKAQQANAQGYNCPMTGEELPCPKCCPLNQKK